MRKHPVRAALGGYLRRCFKPALLFCLCALVALIVLPLYRVPGEALFYTLLLCAALALLVLAVDFSRYCARRTRLAALRDSIVFDLDRLPPPQGQIETDYDTLLRLVHADKLRRLSKAEAARADAEEYYTLWAHQIKTPIAAMRLLLQQEDSELSRELTAQLFRTEQYVEMALSYLRVDSPAHDFVLRRCALDAVVRQAVKKYAALFNRRRIALDLQPCAIQVLTDEKWLCFVVEQLLSNGLKYTPAGGRITIRLEPPATLVVEDNGIGIAAEDLPRVCEKGYTGYNGRADQRATGIGLYLCKRVLTRLGHGLTLSSAPGRGTAVRITLDSPDFRDGD